MEKKTDIKEIIKEMREDLKKEFPGFKFSVVNNHYNAITVALMESPIKIILPFEKMSERAIYKCTNILNNNIEDIKKNQAKGYHQLNEYNLKDKYNEENWCNGVYLTEEGHNMLRRVVEICNKHNWDNSDAMSDYFDVNYYLFLHLGKWDKPLIERC